MRFVEGQRVKLSLAGLGPFSASIRWFDEGVAGVALAESLDPEVVRYLTAF